jgi:hypothetical protein
MNTGQTRVSPIWLSAIAFALLTGLTPASAKQGSDVAGCSSASLNGSYGLYRMGTAPYGTAAAQGLMVFNGEGGWQLRLNISRNGEISLDEEYEGGYDINEDCTGTINEDDARFVVVDDGKSFYLVSAREGLAFVDVGTRIHNGRGNRVDH